MGAITDRSNMDRLQFASSVISSLAWPAVVACLLYLLRAQLGSLADRLKEFTLPGGAKLSFHEQLAAGATEALNLAAKPDGGNIVSNEPKDQISASVPNSEGIDIISPVSSIAARYADVMSHLRYRIDDLPPNLRKDPSDFIYEVLYLESGDKDLYDTFIKIREISASARTANSITIKTADARSYRAICAVFKASFDKTFDAWRVKHQ